MKLKATENLRINGDYRKYFIGLLILRDIEVKEMNLFPFIGANSQET